jgi:hypothetical protein
MRVPGIRISRVLQFPRAASQARSRRRFDLKKLTTTKKLVLKKETMAGLQHVTGGVYANSRLEDTVYRPAPTEYQCATAGCGNA